MGDRLGILSVVSFFLFLCTRALTCHRQARARQLLVYLPFTQFYRLRLPPTAKIIENPTSEIYFLGHSIFILSPLKKKKKDGAGGYFFRTTVCRDRSLWIQVLNHPTKENRPWLSYQFSWPAVSCSFHSIELASPFPVIPKFNFYCLNSPSNN